jgi:hypothetical protein
MSSSLDWRKSRRSGQEGGNCVEVAVFDQDDRRSA